MGQGTRTEGAERVEKTEGQVRRRLLLSGRVQGVFFREATRKEAERIGDLYGWVRNLPDGRVEADVQGPADNVGDLVRFCHEGPEGADVKDVQIEHHECLVDPEPFHVAR